MIDKLGLDGLGGASVRVMDETVCPGCAKEIEALREQVAALNDNDDLTIAYMAGFGRGKDQLAAAQARIVELRDALHRSWMSMKIDTEMNPEIHRLINCTPDDTAALDARIAAEREWCARVCDDQKYMVLQPLRTYTAEDVCRSNKVTANHLAAAIRSLK